jgi:SAM-dependent methyltransferase
MTDTSTKRSRLDRIRAYWDHCLHDQEMSQAPVGSLQWFTDLSAYRFEKLDYLPKVVDFHAFAGRDVLEVGCGIGLDLARFARGGARATGIDLSPHAVALARAHLSQQGLSAHVLEMNGEAMSFPTARFDVVYAHGVVQYTDDPARLIGEIHRVLRPGGRAILMLYHKDSWLMAMSRLTKVGLEHTEAPVFRTFSRRQARALLQAFAAVRIVPERFPVATKLHAGWKAFLYNRVFVPGFNALPKGLTRGWGWHLMIWVVK